MQKVGSAVQRGANCMQVNFAAVASSRSAGEYRCKIW